MFDSITGMESSAGSRGHQARLQEAEVWLAKVALIAALLFGKKRPSARAAEMANSPRPCWLRQERWATPTGTAEALLGREACEAGSTEHGHGVEAHPADPDAAFEDRLVKPRRRLGFRRRRIRRRLRPFRRGPQRPPRRTRQRPGRRPA
jgi:hypothetical protein